MATIAIAGLASCSDDGAESGEMGWVPGRELPDEAVERLAWHAPRSPPETAVNGDEMLLVGGIDVVPSSGLLRLPDSALLVDSADGSVTEISAPRSGTSVNVGDVMADAVSFVVVGTHCDEAGFEVGEYFCLPGSGASFRLDLDDRAWRELALPAEVTSTSPDASWTFQPQLGSMPDGRAFMVVRAGPGAAELPFRLLYLDGDRWVHAAELSAELTVDVCAASDGVYVLSRAPDQPDPSGPPPTAGFQLVKVGLDSGAPALVELPAIDPSSGGPAVAMACDRNGPYVTSAPPDPDVDMALHARRDGTWIGIAGDWGNAIPFEVTSGTDGVALVLSVTGGTTQAFTVATDSATAVALTGDSARRHFEPDPTTGGFVALGPYPQLAADEPAPPDFPISAVSIEP